MSGCGCTTTLDDPDVVCKTCLGTGPESPLNTCPLGVVGNLGINTEIEGSIYTFTAPDGIIIDTNRLAGSWAMINAQLPTGSVSGYLTEVLSGIGSSIATSARTTLGVILVTIILAMFILYTIICIVLVAYRVIDWPIGVTLIFIGLLFAFLAVLISFLEVKSFASDIDPLLFPDLAPIVKTLGCALLSGTCCYSGRSCCCPDGNGTLCTNPPFPPGALLLEQPIIV